MLAEAPAIPVKTECARDKGDDQEYQCPIKHCQLSLVTGICNAMARVSFLPPPNEKPAARSLRRADSRPELDGSIKPPLEPAGRKRAPG